MLGEFGIASSTVQHINALSAAQTWRVAQVLEKTCCTSLGQHSTATVERGNTAHVPVTLIVRCHERQVASPVHILEVKLPQALLPHA